MFDAFTFTHNRKQTTDLLMPTQRLPSKYVTVDTARIVCGAGSVYQSGVHLSVPSVYVATLCCGFAAGRPVGRRYQSTAVGGGPPPAAMAPPQHGRQQQMRAVSHLQPP